MKDAAELQGLLAHYTGTTNWYRHPLSPARCTYTDGVKAFAENAGGGAYWLLDAILIEPALIHAMNVHRIIEVRLEVTEGGKAKLAARRDDGVPDLFERSIEWTDCPPGLWRFYFCDNVLLLPSEY